MPLRIQFVVGCYALLAAILAEIVVAVERTPQYFLERGSVVFLVEIGCACAAYATALILLARKLPAGQDELLRTVILFGLIGGAIEVANIATENGLLIPVRGPTLQIACMLIVFAFWSAVGTLIALRGGSLPRGVLAGVSVAGISVLVAVAAGGLIEFFVAPPSATYVVTWQEYKRSGWSDPRAFAVANTVDSGFTHLLLAPIVAAVLSFAGAWIALRLRNKPNNPSRETMG